MNSAAGGAAGTSFLVVLTLLIGAGASAAGAIAATQPHGIAQNAMLLIRADQAAFI